MWYYKYMNIRIRYFASLREIVGQSEEVLMVHEGGCASDVCALLLERYPRLQSVMDRCIYAVNHRYVTPETVLHDDDELVFIPPMGGGEPFKARSVGAQFIVPWRLPSWKEQGASYATISSAYT
jgi:molybdopterin converting factor subunit 1